MATQGPLNETVEDFWRMLWEHNSTIIVMLTKQREMGREKCAQYWPSDRSARYQCFVVDPLAEYNMPQYLLREFKVTDARDGSSRTVRQFQFTDWPEQGTGLLLFSSKQKGHFCFAIMVFFYQNIRFFSTDINFMLKNAIKL